MSRISSRTRHNRPEQYSEITQDLISLVECDPELRALLERSIRKATTINDDPETHPVRTLSEYYEFVDETFKLFPEHVLENPSILARDRMLGRISYFYFLIDQELPSLQDCKRYRPTLQYYEPFTRWLSKFVEEWGSFLDTEASWNDKVYEYFCADPRFGLDDDWYESPSNWNTFNDFFSRRLRTPEVRPIAPGESVVVSPADAVPMGVWDIDGESTLSSGVKLKALECTDVGTLFSEDSDYTDAFAGGTFTHAFLNVHDYHRYHFPVSGTVVETAICRDNVAMEVNWNDEKRQYEPVPSIGWQFSQTRGYVVIDTGEHGLVACMPVGMAHVSSVTFENDVQVGRTFEKGDPLGTFRFGGSDFVLLFQSDAEFELVAPKAELTATGDEVGYDHLKMGERYGVLNG